MSCPWWSPSRWATRPAVSCWCRSCWPRCPRSAGGCSCCTPRTWDPAGWCRTAASRSGRRTSAVWTSALKTCVVYLHWSAGPRPAGSVWFAARVLRFRISAGTTHYRYRSRISLTSSFFFGHLVTTELWHRLWTTHVHTEKMENVSLEELELINGIFLQRTVNSG